jgi:hypothetical protein
VAGGGVLLAVLRAIVWARMHRFNRPSACSFMVLVASVLPGVCGCHLVGPASILQGRVSHNVAMQQTNSEQMLLNIVCLRYRDPPYFLEIAGVTSAFELRRGGTASFTDPRSMSKPNVFGAKLALVCTSSARVAI